MIIVSACLAGVECAYDGKARTCEAVVDLVKQGKALPVCAEQLGGMPTPRIPAERSNSNVLNRNGTNVTDCFNKGAEEVLKLVKLVGCNEAILKSKSPSCGCGNIYDGSFSGRLIEGDGVTAELLKGHGVNVINESEL